MSLQAGRGAEIVFAFLVLTAAAAAGVVVPYDFTIKPDQSGLDASIGLTATTGGTLIGNFDSEANPTGTRTKPGLFGPFGDDENVPVNVSLGLGLVGSPNTRTAGGFRLDLDLAAGVMNLSNYAVDFLDSGPESLTAEITLETETFRTRNPTFIYIGGIPITIPIGELTLSALSAAQVGDIAPGVVTPIDANRYSFVVAPLVTLSGAIEILGTPIELPGVPVPLPLAGEIELNGDLAHLTSVQPLDLSAMLDPNAMLPEFPLDLPTFDPDNPAHVLMNLMLSEIGAELTGELRTEANGVVVPEPASAALLLVAVGLLRRRSNE